MSGVTEAGTTDAATPPAATPSDRPAADSNLLGVAAVALVAGGGLAGAGYVGALPLLVAIAVVQAAFAFGWVLGTGMPGRRGGLIVAGLAAAGADVAVSLRPDDRLGVLAAVLGLAIPVAFVHQLTRGAARVQLVSSLSAVSLLIVAEVSIAALLQLRHEFAADGRTLTGPAVEGRLVAAVAAAALGAVVVGCLMDLVAPVPRFDPAVPRGILGLAAGAGIGAAIGHLLLGEVSEFEDGRAVFLGAAIGALAALLAVAAAFVQHTTPRGRTVWARLGRPVYAALLPVCILAPAAFLLCLAIRS